MDKNHFSKYAALSAVTALATAVITIAGFLSLARAYPEFALEIFSGTSRKEEGAPGLYPSESVVVETVERASPAVVAITISKNIPVYERYFESFPGPFGDLWSFAIPQYRQRGVRKQEVGGGSGFLISADGYILTNRHVVDDENAEYAVFMNDGAKYDAEVVRRDPELDLALLKIEGRDFPHLPFGDSDRLKVGQSVIAIGNALAEFRNTVSLGIVSGLSRSIVASDSLGNREPLEELIQTDAAVNQGNSGGPLLNLKGEVVGVNVAVAAEAENIGFAISGNSVKRIVESVANAGE